MHFPHGAASFITKFYQQSSTMNRIVTKLLKPTQQRLKSSNQIAKMAMFTSRFQENKNKEPNMTTGEFWQRFCNRTLLLVNAINAEMGDGKNLLEQWEKLQELVA